MTKGLSQWMCNLYIKYRNHIEYWTTILWHRLMIRQSKAEVLTDLQTSQMTFSSYSMPSPSSVLTMVCTFSQQRISNSSITRSSWSSVTGCSPATLRMARVAAQHTDNKQQNVGLVWKDMPFITQQGVSCKLKVIAMRKLLKTGSCIVSELSIPLRNKCQFLSL